MRNLTGFPILAVVAITAILYCAGFVMPAELYAHPASGPAAQATATPTLRPRPTLTPTPPASPTVEPTASPTAEPPASPTPLPPASPTPQPPPPAAPKQDGPASSEAPASPTPEAVIVLLPETGDQDAQQRVMLLATAALLCANVAIMLLAPRFRSFKR